MSLRRMAQRNTVAAAPAFKIAKNATNQGPISIRRAM